MRKAEFNITEKMLAKARKLVEKCGLSKSGVARAVGTSPSQITYLMQGQAVSSIVVKKVLNWRGGKC